MKAIEIVVVGVTFKDGKVSRQKLLGKLYDDYWTEARRGEILVELRPEPDNPADPNAVGVYVVKPEEAQGRVGFVPATEAPRVGKLIARDLVRATRVKSMHLTRKSKVGMTLKLLVGKPEHATDATGQTWEILS